MSIKKTLLAAAGIAALVVGSAFAEPEFKPYATAQYRFWERFHSADDGGNSSAVFDHSNRFAWRAGFVGSVDERYSVQFQAGNDWVFTEEANWRANNFPAARLGWNNLHVHLANFRWNPGYLYFEGGVIGVGGNNAAFDLLERSLGSGKYGEAIYTGWTAHSSGGLIGLRVGAPVVKGGSVKIGAEVTHAIVDSRTVTRFGAAGNVIADPAPNPSSALFALNVPVDAGVFKITPEVIAVLNRNYNPATEKGDHEIVAGFGASCKINDAVSLTLNGAYGAVGNENSRVGAYGVSYSIGNADNPARTAALADGADAYISNGLLVGIGTAIKAGPGSILVDFKYNGEVNSITKETENATKNDYYLADLRYSFKVHKNVTVIPRFRSFIRDYAKDRPDGRKYDNEYRPELILEGSF